MSQELASSESRPQSAAMGNSRPQSAEQELSLQQRFEQMRARKQAAAARVKAAENARARGPRPEAAKEVLREKFVTQVRSYVGTPYSAARNPEEVVGDLESSEEAAPLFLDCCGLVRRALLDLKEDFGFEIGPWNQSYLYDTLPTALTDTSQLKPGDVIFWSATYDNPERKPHKHDLVHVEVFLGGEATIGSRFEGPGLIKGTPGVYMFDTYKSFTGHQAHNYKLHFRSIDAWLDGICVNHCKTCSWCEPGPKKMVGGATRAPGAPITFCAPTKSSRERKVAVPVGNGIELNVRCR